MAINFDDAILSSNGFSPTKVDTPLDKRSRIESISEVPNIPNPFVGMIFYVSSEDKYYRVKSLKSKVVGGITVQNAQVNEYVPFETGGSGTSDYSKLENKPSIGGVTLEGNKTLDNLGIPSKESVEGKQDVINQVNVSVGSGTGTPSGSASVSGSTLNIFLENIKGQKGSTGSTGPANNITIGTVTPSDSTDEASATLTGESPNQVLNLVLPRGRQGNSGITGSPEDMVVVNDLNGGESEVGAIKVLAAEQGKVLKEKIDEIESSVITYDNIKLEFTNNQQAYGDVGSSIQFGELTNCSYAFVSGNAGEQYKVALTTVDGKVPSSYIQIIGNDGNIKRRLFEDTTIYPTALNTEITLNANETGFYISGTTNSISCLKRIKTPINNILDKMLSNVDVVGYNSNNLVSLGNLFMKPILGEDYQSDTLEDKYAKLYKIPCDNSNEIIFPVFFTTSGYGCAFVDESDLVIEEVVNDIRPSGTIVTKKVPSTAKYFIFGYTSKEINGNWSVIVTGENYKEVDVNNQVGAISEQIKIILENILIDGFSKYTYENSKSIKDAFLEPTVGSNYNTNITEDRYAKLYKIPCHGFTEVAFPVFLTTSGFGCAFIDENDLVVEEVINDTKPSGTIVTKEIPSNAYYFIFGYSSKEMKSDWSVIVTGEDGKTSVKEQVEEIIKKLDNIPNSNGSSINKNSIIPSFSFEDFGDIPSCLASDEVNFIPNELDENGDAVIKYNDLIAKYDALVSAYPNYVTKNECGYDASGTIMMYSYTFEPKYWKQSIYLQAGVHGWEPEPVFALAQIMYLISNSYGDKCGIPYIKNNSTLMFLRGNVKFTVFPCVNPYGFNKRGDCGIDKRDVAQNNYNNVQLNSSWDSSEPENVYVRNIIESIKNELSFSIDMHSTVWENSREKYGCFYAGINKNAENARTIYRTYQFLYDFYDVKYPDIVQGDTCPNPIGDYASIGYLTGCFHDWIYSKYGIQSATMEFSDHTWTKELHTSIAQSVAVNMYLNHILQLISDKYKVNEEYYVLEKDYYPTIG